MLIFCFVCLESCFKILSINKKLTILLSSHNSPITYNIFSWSIIEYTLWPTICNTRNGRLKNAWLQDTEQNENKMLPSQKLKGNGIPETWKMIDKLFDLSIIYYGQKLKYGSNITNKKTTKKEKEYTKKQTVIEGKWM